jgi:hypothetical protein
MLAAPIIGLYLLGVVVACLFGKRREAEHSGLALLAVGIVLDAPWCRASSRSLA